MSTLEKKHAKAWLEPIRGFIRSWQISRGLLGEVTCDAGSFIEAAEVISLRAPRGTLTLTGVKAKQAQALVATPLGRFESVSLIQQRLDDAAIAALAGSASVAGVRTWQLGYNGFGDAGLKAIAASPNFASTQELHLSDSGQPITANGIGAVIASEHLSRLKKLSFNLTGPLGESLARGAMRLNWLAIQGPSLSDADVAAVASSPVLSEVRTLSLPGMTEARADQLIAALPKLLIVNGSSAAAQQVLLERMMKSSAA